MQSDQNPYALSLAHKNKPDNYKTTYTTSYLKMPTFQVSPAYEPIREPAQERRWFPQDLSPYPSARDNSPIRNRRPYQQMSYDEEDEMARRQKEREYRSRFEDYTLRRDEYREPPPRNEHDYDQMSEFNGPSKGQYQPDERMREARKDYLRAQFNDLVVDGQSTDDLRNVECEKCGKRQVCLNQLGCSHRYCDECMALMPGSDGPFRDSIRWHYCCSTCRKWTPEQKLVRLDPYGRRLMKFHDIGYFKTS